MAQFDLMNKNHRVLSFEYDSALHAATAVISGAFVITVSFGCVATATLVLRGKKSRISDSSEVEASYISLATGPVI